MKQLQNRWFSYYLFCSISWFLVVVYLLIFYRSKDINSTVANLDKVIHFVLFFIQCYFISRAYFSLYNTKKVPLKIIISLLIFCCTIELLQIGIPYRSFDINDLFANIFGSVGGSIFGYILVSK